MSKDYRVEIRVKNNWLLKMIEERGYDSIADFSRKHKLHPAHVCSYVNFRLTPIRSNGEWRGSFLRIADALQCMPEDICPPQHLKEALKKSRTHVEVGVEEIKHFISSTTNSPLTPIDHLLREEGLQSIETHLSCLTPREERIIRLRFGLTPDGKEHTYKEIAKEFGLQHERIRQIEIKVLKLFKDASRTNVNKSLTLKAVAESWGIHGYPDSPLPNRHYIPEWKQK